jgi:hypothetical protein
LAFQVGRRDADTIAFLWEKLNVLGVKGPVHTDELRAFYKIIPESQRIDDGKRERISIVEGLNTCCGRGVLAWSAGQCPALSSYQVLVAVGGSVQNRSRHAESIITMIPIPPCVNRRN